MRGLRDGNQDRKSRGCWWWMLLLEVGATPAVRSAPSGMPACMEGLMVWAHVERMVGCYTSFQDPVSQDRVRQAVKKRTVLTWDFGLGSGGEPRNRLLPPTPACLPRLVAARMQGRDNPPASKHDKAGRLVTTPAKKTGFQLVKKKILIIFHYF